MIDETLTINLDIEEAIQHGDLTVHYQPIFNISTVNPILVEVEALIRWNHPKLGLLSPTEFDIWLTSDQIMTQLTDYVLQHVMEQQVIWQKQNITLPIIVNLPVHTLNDIKFPQRLADFIDQFKVGHASLILELAEHKSRFFSDFELTNMGRLIRDGFPIIFDNFGQNPVILTDLSRLSLAGLKIDARLISNLADNKVGQSLVRGIINLAHELSFPVYVKNVENQKALSVLKVLGCDKAQGWYLGKPMSPSDVTKLLAVQTRIRPQSETAVV